MVKLRGKIEKPKLTDILEEAPTKARVLRGLLILGTGIATMLAYKAIAESKMVSKLLLVSKIYETNYLFFIR